MNDSI